MAKSIKIKRTAFNNYFNQHGATIFLFKAEYLKKYYKYKDSFQAKLLA